MDAPLKISLIAVAFSGIATIISAVALGWNIMRDFVQRPRFIVKLKAEVFRDSGRVKGGLEETFTLSGTITPFNFRTTIEKLTLNIPSLRDKNPRLLSHKVDNTIGSGELCKILWREQNALRILNGNYANRKLFIAIHHAAAKAPFKKTIRLKVKSV